jgi:N-acetylglucosaminyldiphosphoundecaprenol N-acetyl-beta-D-mannosaminyltransferase
MQRSADVIVYSRAASRRGCINMGGGAVKTVVGGIPVDVLRAHDWVELLISDWRAKVSGAPPKVVTTANGQVVSIFARNQAYRKAVLDADHVAADGMSIVVASRHFGSHVLPERVSTTDWFHDAARAAERHGIRFFMMGATRQANAKAVACARSLYPSLQIVGARHGYFRDQEIFAVADEIAQSRPDVLWLGLGNPRQVYVAHLFKQLLPSLTWIRTCGGLFDFLAGDAKRAPLILQQAGFEWAYRVMREPRRLAWRYATTNVHAAFLLATKSGAAAAAVPAVRSN